MDVMTSAVPAGGDRAIRFTGNWREYLPIAATNALKVTAHDVHAFNAAALPGGYIVVFKPAISDFYRLTPTFGERRKRYR